MGGGFVGKKYNSGVVEGILEVWNDDGMGRGGEVGIMEVEGEGVGVGGEEMRGELVKMVGGG